MHEIRIIAAKKDLKSGVVVYGTINKLGLGEEATFPDYQRQAESLQGDFDDDAQPVRVYIFDIKDNLPIYAAGQNAWKHRRQERNPPRRSISHGT